LKDSQPLVLAFSLKNTSSQLFLNHLCRGTYYKGNAVPTRWPRVKKVCKCVVYSLAVPNFFQPNRSDLC
jgi:hypothetical protein